MNPPLYVIWDWNGTLLDDVSVSFSIFNAMLVERDIAPVSFERFHSLYTHPIISMYEEIGFPFSDQYTFDDLSVDWYRECEKRAAEVSLFEDTVKSLEHVIAGGGQQLILSALHHDTLLEQVQKHNVAHYFAEISGNDDLRADSKVARAVSVADALGIQRHGAVVIGDTMHDAEMARAIGCRCCLVCRGYESRQKLERTGFPVFGTTLEALTSVTGQ